MRNFALVSCSTVPYKCWQCFQHRVPHCAGLLSHDADADADADADDNPRKPYNPPGNFFGDDESKR